MEVFSLTKENVQAFYPLLPEEFRKPEADESIILLGAAETDTMGENRACGAMVLKVINNNTVLINWLLVDPKYQGRGAGTGMLKLAMEVAGQMSMGIFCIFSAEAKAGPGAPIYHFFQKHGFSMEAREAKTYSIRLGELAKEAFFQREQKSDDGIRTLEETPLKLITELNHTLVEKNHLPYGYISKEQAVSDVSLVHVDNESITACVIFRELGEGTVELSFAYSGKRGTLQLPMLLLRAQSLFSRRYGQEKELVIPCVTEVSRKLVEALVPSAVVIRVSFGAYWSPKQDI
ncbi:MAG: GNAT family N-acetyltransferase [Clostridia bacterium]|nr:GNAT family N-acetyltransferase [Clostridia bacterium]